MFMLGFHTPEDKAKGNSVTGKIRYAERDGNQLRFVLAGQLAANTIPLAQFLSIVASSDADTVIHYYRTQEDEQIGRETANSVYYVNNAAAKTPMLNFLRLDGTKDSIPFERPISVTSNI